MFNSKALEKGTKLDQAKANFPWVHDILIFGLLTMNMQKYNLYAEVKKHPVIHDSENNNNNNNTED